MYLTLPIDLLHKIRTSKKCSTFGDLQIWETFGMTFPIRTHNFELILYEITIYHNLALQTNEGFIDFSSLELFSFTYDFH